MSHADATRLARLELGGVEQIKEACRDERGIAPIEQRLQDLHYASRAVRHQPAFALTVNKGAEGPAAWLRSGAGSPTSEAWPAAMHD